MRTTRKGRDPKNNREWQEAANAAEALLHVHAAQCYGLIAGCPDIDVGRCERLIKLASQKGVVPEKDCVERFLVGHSTTGGKLLQEKPR